MRNHLLYIGIILLLVSSCKSKKVTTETKIEYKDRIEYRDRLVTDTVKIEKEVIKTKLVQSESVIDSPCDENGKIRDINTVITSGKNRSYIYSKDGKLYIEQLLDSTNQASEKYYRTKFVKDSTNLVERLEKEYIKNSIKVKYVYPWWIYAVCIGGVIFLLLWLRSKFMLF